MHCISSQSGAGQDAWCYTDLARARSRTTTIYRANPTVHIAMIALCWQCMIKRARTSVVSSRITLLIVAKCTN